MSKKGNAKECSNYQTIELISHASIIMIKILQARLQQYMNHGLPEVQGGFRKGRGTRDQVANILNYQKSERVPGKQQNGKDQNSLQENWSYQETFHAKMATIKDRNSMDLTEAEDIKKKWEEYTELQKGS